MSTAATQRELPHVLGPADTGYDDARAVWNAMFDRRPREIWRCRDASDVAAAVARARAQDLEVGVRCGGHSMAGHCVPADGLMIDLTPMGDVRVDPQRRLARVQGGALLRSLDVASQAHGLATTAGNVSHTGVGGLTLGGGMGWLARQHGLACDNVISFEVVTADGESVRASSDENPELYWGLRGGGGNFGVVTEFEFELHPTGTRALSVELDFPVPDAAPAMSAWRDLAATAPRAATYAAMVTGGVVTLGLVWVGDPDAGREHARALSALGRPSAERLLELAYLELQSREDAIRGHTFRSYVKGHYLGELSDAAIEAFLAHDPHVGASLQAYGGAIADVADEATAFSHRATAFEYVGATRWTDPAEDEERKALVREGAARVGPFASGAYVNTLSDDGLNGVQRAYPPAKLARLRALKDRWDPDNVFHLNQNIPPTRATSRAPG